MRSNLKFSNGKVRESKTRFAPATSSAARAARTLQVNVGESIGSIALRAYGANTAQNRAKIAHANSSLKGQIVIPK